MAGVYSERIFFKGSGVASPLTWFNAGPGVVVIHDMIYWPGDLSAPFGAAYAVIVQSIATSCVYWQVPASYVTSGSTVHWTGRLVCPPEELIEVSTMSTTDSLIACGYNLVP